MLDKLINFNLNAKDSLTVSKLEISPNLIPTGPISSFSPRILSAIEIYVQRMEAREEPAAFNLVDLTAVKDQYFLWLEALPSVKPFYSIKANNDSRLIKTLADLGCAFDCASRGELDSALDVAPNAEIIFAHPIKTTSAIQYSAKRGTHLMTFDCLPELKKMVKNDSEVKPILRIAVSGIKPLVSMVGKYGASEQQAEMIFEEANEMGARIEGISFHAGSGVADYGPMEEIFQYVRKIYDCGKRKGHPMKIMDIGGGILPGSRESILKYGQFVESSLKRHFSGEDIIFIGEPGRFMATPVQYGVYQVLQVAPNGKKSRVFINDGIYGSLNYIDCEKRDGHGVPLKKREGTMLVDVWGQTLDSLDIIEQNRVISVVEEGDWIVYANNGAYGTVLATDFNGYTKSERVYVEDVM